MQGLSVAAGDSAGTRKAEAEANHRQQGRLTRNGLRLMRPAQHESRGRQRRPGFAAKSSSGSQSPFFYVENGIDFSS